MSDGLDKAIYDAVRKKATGYTTSECVDEYSMVDGELCVVKRKITTKEVPPDIAAVKLIMDEMHTDKYQAMSEEELMEEKQRLLRLLKEAENATNDGKTQN